MRQVAKPLLSGKLSLGLTLTPLAQLGATPDDTAIGSRSHMGDETLECETQKTVGREPRKPCRRSHPDEFTVASVFGIVLAQDSDLQDEKREKPKLISLAPYPRQRGNEMSM